MNDDNLLGELRHVESILHRAVTPTDDGDHLAPEVGKRTVADRARGHAATALCQALLVLKSDPVGIGPRGYDHGIAFDLCAAAGLQQERTNRKIHLRHVVGDYASVEAHGLRLEVLHHVDARHPLGKPGVVLYLGREHELPAGNHCAASRALNDEGRKIGAGRINSRGPRCRPGSDDDDLFVLTLRHGPISWSVHDLGPHLGDGPFSTYLILGSSAVGQILLVLEGLAAKRTPSSNP